MTPEETLRAAIDRGILDLTQIQAQVEDMTRKELLEKHEFSIWEAKNGKFYTYLREADGRVVQRRRNTRKEIEDLVCEHVRSQEDNPTLRELFIAWNDDKLERKKISASTHSRHDCDFRRYFGDFGYRRVKNIKPEEIRDFLESQVPKYDLTAKAFSNLKTIVRGMLKYAKRRGLIEWSYEAMLSDVDVSDRDFRKIRHEDYEEVYSTDEQQRIMQFLMANMDPKNMGLLLLFITGIRVGELATLKPENIEEDCITIRRTETKFYDEKRTRHIDVKEFPKSEAGWRTVVIPSDWLWLLRRIREASHGKDWCFIFPDGQCKGRRIDVQAFERRLRKVNRTLGIYQKSPHKIRKTYGSILLDDGLDQNFIMQQMGHASIWVTERHYHRNRKGIERKRAILDTIGDLKIGTM